MKKHLTVLLLSILSIFHCFGQQRPFITHWKANEEGKIKINTFSDPQYVNTYIYNYSITWKSLTNPSLQGATTSQHYNYTITGLIPGDSIEVAITGVFPTMRMGADNFEYTDKLYKMIQWGDIEWLDLSYFFKDCINMEYFAEDIPITSQVKNMECMFYNCKKFNGDLNSWDVSKVTTLYSAFFNAEAFNGNITGWKVSKVIIFRECFFGAASFNQDISNWNISGSISSSAMFYGASSFNQDISKWKFNTKNVFDQMFVNAISFNQNLGSWIVSKSIDFDGMFVNSGMSYCNIDNTLRGWINNGIKQGSYFGNISAYSDQSLLDYLITNKDASIYGTRVDPPEINLNISSVNVCGGNSIHLDVSTTLNTTINWNIQQLTPDLSQSFTPDHSQYIIVSQVFQDGCEISDSIFIHVLPELQIRTSSDVICSGDEVIIIVSGAETYLWNNGITENTITDRPESSIIYSVTATAEDGCTSVTPIPVTVNDCLEFDDRKAQREIVIYPNPAKTSFAISGENIHTVFDKYIIFDLTGKEITSGNLITDNQTISVDLLNDGIYFIHLTGSTNQNFRFEIHK